MEIGRGCLEAHDDAMRVGDAPNIMWLAEVPLHGDSSGAAWGMGGAQWFSGSEEEDDVVFLNHMVRTRGSPYDACHVPS